MQHTSELWGQIDPRNSHRNRVNVLFLKLGGGFMGVHSILFYTFLCIFNNAKQILKKAQKDVCNTTEKRSQRGIEYEKKLKNKDGRKYKTVKTWKY